MALLSTCRATIWFLHALVSNGARASQPRLSLLLQFNDVLLYTSRGLTISNQFKVHGQLPLYGMTVSMQHTWDRASPSGLPAACGPG